MPTRRDWLLGAAGLIVFGDARAQVRLEPGIRGRSGDVRVSGDRITTGAASPSARVCRLDILIPYLPWPYCISISNFCIQ